ncbi:hypothetical protein H310_14256 [Aphanomyces invadans]|uniref:START domain-containing protein n=1 Tax=Aphanomyces invadans TaxID=157072 RepID=A0A024TAC0_9STRA|nr:hypothetical protein H310_14256 [Aphanomyces invadans]ETV91100.1 hypothetical protein H310_14256 [Aphanomyces invadans]|eukprot:XP_008880296.1 hypothetical protein H310_14256 [Aphanomyces invadans]
MGDSNAVTARLRMRTFRANLKSDAHKLQVEIEYLEKKLERLRQAPPSTRSYRAPFAMATDVLLSHSNRLRKHVEARTRLIRELAVWLSAQRPLPANFSRSSWMETTLVADPVCRRQGYRWLTERALHMAVLQHPNHSFQGDDQVTITLHTSPVDGGTWRDEANEVVDGTSSRVQVTVFASIDKVAKGYWKLFTQGIASSPMVEWVDSDLVYFHSINPFLGTSKQSILRRFDPSPRQVVFTIVNVSHDEIVPLTDGQMRTHGVSCMILDEVSTGITLVRSTDLALAPLTCDGKASLETMGMLLGVPPRLGNDSPTVYLEKIRSAVDSYQIDQVGFRIMVTNRVVADVEAERT